MEESDDDYPMDVDNDDESLLDEDEGPIGDGKLLAVIDYSQLAIVPESSKMSIPSEKTTMLKAQQQQAREDNVADDKDDQSVASSSSSSLSSDRAAFEEFKMEKVATLLPRPVINKNDDSGRRLHETQKTTNTRRLLD
jgi:hypothetical protein